jgi:4-amino-4-deoxy-L-arabinose transferase-like glycosyltransferase
LGARDLWNPNEPIYGEAVAEMARRADWLLPHVNGLVFAEKPILYYWLALAAAKLSGGISELSLRLPSAAAAIATVLGSYVLVRPYAGRARAVATAILCATLFGVFWNARAVQMDILVTASTVWTIVGVTRVVDHGAPALSGFLLAGAAAGLGFAAKGPVAWICPGLTLAAYLVATRRVASVARWEAVAGAAACVAVASPWYLLLLARGREDVVAEVLFRQNVERFVNPWDHRAPWWYYLESVWIDMAPWAFFAPLAVGLPRRAEGEKRLARLAYVWVAAVLVFFSLSRSKRGPYVLPIAPAVATLSADVVLGALADDLAGFRKRWFALIAWSLAIALVAAGGFVAVGAALWAAAGAAGPIGVLGATAVAGGTLLVVELSSRGRRARAPLALVAATTAIYLAAGGIALPALDRYKSARPFCDEVAALARPGDELASFSFWDWRAEYRYYLGVPIINLAGEEPLRSAWTGDRRVVLLVEGARLSAARAVIGAARPAVTGRVGGMSVYAFTNR